MKTGGVWSGLLALALGVLLFPLLFARPQTAKVTRVLSNFMLSGSEIGELTTDPVILDLPGASEKYLTRGRKGDGNVGLEVLSLYNLKFLLSAPIYGQTLEYSNAYSHREAETGYSIDELFGWDTQQTILTSGVINLNVSGRVRSIGSGAVEQGGAAHYAVVTDALEVSLLGPRTDALWTTDLSSRYDLTFVTDIDDFFVTVQATPTGVVSGPARTDGAGPAGVGVVLATWRLTHMTGRKHFMFVALDASDGAVRWASIAETVTREFDQAVYFHVPEGSAANVDAVLAQMAIPRLHGGAHAVLPVDANPPADRAQSQLGTILREGAGVSDLAAADSLLFISPQHVISAGLVDGAYHFGAILHSAVLLFARGGVPYVAYVADIDGNYSLYCVSVAPGARTNTLAWRRELRDSLVAPASAGGDRAGAPLVSLPRPAAAQRPLLVQTTPFDPPALIVLSPTGFLHSFGVGGEANWLRAVEGVRDPSQVSMSLQTISGKPLVVLELADSLLLIWADSGDVAASIPLKEAAARSILFAAVAPSPAPPALLVASDSALDVYALSGFGNESASFGFWGRFVLMALSVFLAAAALSAFPPPESKDA